jgi:hypothetical protein
MSACEAAALLLALLATPAPPALPAPVVVPEALLDRTSMPEPSGVVWSPALSRYLIISDDTGDKARGTAHAPWLFAMGPDGVLDRDIVPILGLARLNDAEALCPGPAGSYFLATSHARDRKGRDKAERRQLLHLGLSGRALRVLGTLDLAPLSGAPAVPSGPLDIEALAFRDGALYLGLKAPLTASGAAIILRIPEVMAALRAGAPAAQQVQRFAEVLLSVEGPAGPAAQGISDMSFLPDGSLALLANAPKGAPPDGGGALWRVRPGAAPQLVRRFSGLKPEGITPTADGRALLIVFDRDRQPPLWLVQPLPR